MQLIPEKGHYFLPKVPDLVLAAKASLEIQQQKESRFEGVQIDEVVKTLDDLGYSYEIGGSLRGMSGAMHHFDIICKGNVVRITIDFLPTRDHPNPETVLIRSRVKFYDCSPDLGIIICLNEISDDLKRLSEFYRFTIIEAADSGEACQKLAKLLADHLISSDYGKLRTTNS